MASRKKQSEGIALLSMYNDEEEDEDMEDAEGGGMEEEEEPREGGGGDDDDDDDRREPRSLDDALMADSDRFAGGDSGEEEYKLRDDGESSAATMTTHARAQLRPPTPQQSQVVVSSESERSRRGRFGIVDYGHDEVAMSPEPEDGDLERSNRAMFGADHETSIGDFHDKTPPGTVQVLIHSNQATPQLSDPSQSDKMNYAVDNSEIENGAEPIEEEKKDVDPLDKFLPLPSKEKCSEDLQRKINKFLEYKKAGKSFNAEVRNRKDYRNPDFLLHAVSYQDIDQIGSCFSKDVFDPHGYDPSDYYDEIEADLRRDMERKEQERKMSQKVEFFSAGTQPVIIPGAAKINLPIPGPPPGLPTGTSALPSADTLPRDGRQNKKSKWDKVDGDRRNPLPSGVPDPVLTVGSQTTTTLSAANVGAGYTAFVQQRRREAEERSRKLERRS